MPDVGKKSLLEASESLEAHGFVQVIAGKENLRLWNTIFSERTITAQFSKEFEEMVDVGKK